MAEHYSIPSQEEAERFSEAYLAAQRDYFDTLEDIIKETLPKKLADEVFEIAERTAENG